jgi:hypothetical protein
MTQCSSGPGHRARAARCGDDYDREPDLTLLRFAFLDAIADTNLTLRFRDSLQAAIKLSLTGLRAQLRGSDSQALTTHGRLAVEHGECVRAAALRWAQRARATLRTTPDADTKGVRAMPMRKCPVERTGADDGRQSGPDHAGVEHPGPGGAGRSEFAGVLAAMVLARVQGGAEQHRCVVQQRRGDECVRAGARAGPRSADGHGGTFLPPGAPL